MNLRRLSGPALVLATMGGALLSSCGGNGHTGFIVTVFRPDTTSKAPGVDYDTLYVDVVMTDGAEASTSVTITPQTPAPYVVLVLVDKQAHKEAQSIDVALKLHGQSGTTIAAYNFPPETIVEHQLTPINVDLSAQ